MSAMTCLHCTAETDNGLALCETCRAAAAVYLEFLPVYFRNLARWRPGRAGSRQVPGSRVLYSGEAQRVGTGDRISDTLDETANMLTTWARVLVEARPYLGRLLDRLAAARQAERLDEAQQVAWLCRGFERYLISAATQDWCGEFVRDLAEHETRLRILTEVAAPGWYAGHCMRCRRATYVVPGLTWVTCTGCGVTTHVQTHLETIIEEARGWVARPMRLAEAVVALVDTELSVPRMHKRISKWGERGRIQPIRRTERGYEYDSELQEIVLADHEVGFARYRLGEVLDVVFADSARQRNTPKDSQAS